MKAEFARTLRSLPLTVLVAFNLSAARAGEPSPASHAAEAKSQPTNAPVVYSIASGRIEIKPRLKYELFLSLHVLQTAEDHHRLFVPWAQRMRASLQPKTLRQAAKLVQRVHEWGLCSTMGDYDGPDTIEGITNYLRADPDKAVKNLLGPTSLLGFNNLGVDTWRFDAADLADFVSRYYAEGFGKEWPEHRKLIEEQAAADARALEQLPYSITEFMEKRTGRKFKGSAKIIFYPSSFSRPQHAYEFSEKGAKVVVYKVGDSPVGTAFHELLHPLLNGWHKPERMRKVIAELGQQPLFRAEAGRIRSSYSYPEGCLEEFIVHAVANYLCVKASLLSEPDARRQTYGGYENALYDAIFDRYDSFPLIDDFIYHALTHIKVVSEGGVSRFEYVKDDDQRTAQ